MTDARCDAPTGDDVDGHVTTEDHPFLGWKGPESGEIYFFIGAIRRE
jgi:hypothetical protein